MKWRDMAGRPLSMRVKTEAALWIGHGESTGNNRGPDVEYFRANDGTGKRASGRGDWCASFASFVLESTLFSSIEPSRGARRLVRNASLWHWDITDLKHWRLGLIMSDQSGLISWKRRRNGRWHPWKGHVGIWVGYEPDTDTLHTIEGNRRRRGQKLAKVDRFVYPNGAWRKGLDRMVML